VSTETRNLSSTMTNYAFLGKDETKATVIIPRRYCSGPKKCWNVCFDENKGLAGLKILPANLTNKKCTSPVGGLTA
jgi:hypothetical protein